MKLLHLIFLLLISINASAQDWFDGQFQDDQVVRYAIRQHFILNDHPGQTFVIDAKDRFGELIRVCYTRENDSIIAENVMRSIGEYETTRYLVTPDLLVWLPQKAVGYDISTFRDSLNYKVRDTYMSRHNVHRYEIIRPNAWLGSESWTRYSGSDTISYEVSDFHKGLFESRCYEIAGVDTAYTDATIAQTFPVERLVGDTIPVEDWYHEFFNSNAKKGYGAFTVFLLTGENEFGLLDDMYNRRPESRAQIETDKNGMIARAVDSPSWWRETYAEINCYWTDSPKPFSRSQAKKNRRAALRSAGLDGPRVRRWIRKVSSSPTHSN